jgi:hypothetical protein
MLKKLPLAIAILSVVTLASAQDKEPPKWSYVEAGYIDFNPDAGLSDDGWYAGGSVSIIKMLHIFAEYDDVGDYTFWNAGVGWHGLFGDPGDLYAQVQWNDVSVDTGAGSADDDGYEVGVGVRWKFLKWLEAKAEVDWADYDQAGDDLAYQAGVLFTFLGDKVGVGVNYELADDNETLRGFARWNFGR